MKHLSRLALLLLFACTCVAGAAFFAPYPSHADEQPASDQAPSTPQPTRAAKLATAMAPAKITLQASLQIASTKVPGKIVAAHYEVDDGKPVFEVVILSTKDALPCLVEVEVDARTGAIIEVEFGDDDDDAEEDDDEEEDDDHEDEDDE